MNISFTTICRNYSIFDFDHLDLIVAVQVTPRRATRKNAVTQIKRLKLYSVNKKMHSSGREVEGSHAFGKALAITLARLFKDSCVRKGKFTRGSRNCKRVGFEQSLQHMP
jgi:hypothetical protein